jgi:hypothetical protein
MDEKMGKLGIGVVLAATALAASACKVTITAGWEGSASSVTLDWTINGAEPTASICSAVGGSAVVLWASVLDPGCQAGAEGCGESLGTWAWDCAGGHADSGLVFEEGPVWLAWALVAADGSVREATRWQQSTLRPGANGFTFNFTPGFTGAPNAAVDTTWTLGGAEANATSCATEGATTVRLVSRIGGELTEVPLDFACPDGSANTGNVFRATQRYDLRWELRDDADTVLAQFPVGGGWQNQAFVEGDNVFTIDFASSAPDASVVPTWTLHGTAADATSCGDANAVTVRLAWRETGATTEESQDWPCEYGTARTAALFRSGLSYDVSWDLLDVDGATLVRVDWETLVPVAGDNTVDVDFLVGGTLDLTLEWADKVASPAWGDCAWPPIDVDAIGYSLEDGTTGAVITAVDLALGGAPCTTTLSFANLPFATYSITINGRAATGATAWHGECLALVVAGIVDNAFPCRVPMVTP